MASHRITESPERNKIKNQRVRVRVREKCEDVKVDFFFFDENQSQQHKLHVLSVRWWWQNVCNDHSMNSPIQWFTFLRHWRIRLAVRTEATRDKSLLSNLSLFCTVECTHNIFTDTCIANYVPQWRWLMMNVVEHSDVWLQHIDTNRQWRHLVWMKTSHCIRRESR